MKFRNMQDHGAVGRSAIRAVIWGWLLIMGGAHVGWAPEWAFGQEQARIIDGDPYDQLTLKSGETLRLTLMDLKPRAPIPPGNAGTTIKIRLFGKPDQIYEVDWNDIQKLELFEEMALAEAAALLRKDQFDEALDYYHALEKRDPDFPGVKQAAATAMFREAQYWVAQKSPDQALALMLEANSRVANLPELESHMASVVEGLARVQIEKGNYGAARTYLKTLGERYPQNAVLARLRQTLSVEAAKFVDEARQALAANRISDAYRAASHAVIRWPTQEGVKELMIDLHKRYPVLTIGVAQGGDGLAERLSGDWVARRQSRLTHRLLVEPVARDSKGWSYESPLGQLKNEPSAITLTIGDEVRWPGRLGKVTGYDVALRMIALADAQRATADPQWVEMFLSAEPEDHRAKIAIRGRRAQLSACLQTPLFPWNTPVGTAPATTGPYAVAFASPTETRFVANPGYFAASEGQAQEIVERVFVDARQALKALSTGEIVAIDRLDPIDAQAATRTAQVVVEPYLSPTVCFLAPNSRKPLLANLAFRRGLSFAIPRNEIVKSAIAGKEAPEIARELESLFPADWTENSSLEMTTYNPRQAIVLFGLALGETAAPVEGESEEKSAAPTPLHKIQLVIAHPPTSSARRAVRLLQKYLGPGGLNLNVSLKEIAWRPGQPVPDECDLLYVEWPNFDPLTDARLILGVGGLAAVSGDWLPLAVRRLESAESRDGVSRELSALARLTQAELPVIPLWQFTEYCAYRKTLDGFGRDPITLYQTIEGWRAPAYIPAE